MAICDCGLPAGCCQLAVAGGVIYADLLGELSTHLVPTSRLCLLRVLCSEPLLQAFPFPSTLGEVTLHPLSQACVFIYSLRGSGSFSLSCGVFLPPLLSQAFLLLVAGARPCTRPLWPGPAYLFTVLGGIPLPTFCAQGPPPCLQHVFIVLIAYYSVLFFPGWGLVCPGGYADLAQGCVWKYHIPISSPCGPRLPKLSGRR
jgi:hypothetical protein